MLTWRIKRLMCRASTPPAKDIRTLYALIDTDARAHTGVKGGISQDYLMRVGAEPKAEQDSTGPGVCLLPVRGRA